MGDEEKKKQILDVLKRDKELAMGEIAFLIKTNYYKTKYLLSELKVEGKITNEIKGRGISLENSKIMAKKGEKEQEVYNIDKNCSNCKAMSFLKIPKGTTVKEFLKSESMTCRVCGCSLIETKEKE